MLNGFRVSYVTIHNVTSKRLDEICSRPHIKEASRKLSVDAPLHFGSMLYTDIYLFAEFARKYDVDPDIEMHNIFVLGPDKEKLYIGDNPRIQNPAQYINRSTSQGLLYLSRDYIRYHSPDSKKVYRFRTIMSIEELKQKPLWQMTGEEFLFLQETCMKEIGIPVASKEEHKSDDYDGLKGIAALFQCSISTANRIKMSGVINKACKQIGRKIIVNKKMALELASGKRGGRR